MNYKNCVNTLLLIAICIGNQSTIIGKSKKSHKQCPTVSQEDPALLIIDNEVRDLLDTLEELWEHISPENITRSGNIFKHEISTISYADLIDLLTNTSDLISPYSELSTLKKHLIELVIILESEREYIMDHQHVYRFSTNDGGVSSPGISNFLFNVQVLGSLGASGNLLSRGKSVVVNASTEAVNTVIGQVNANHTTTFPRGYTLSGSTPGQYILNFNIPFMSQGTYVVIVTPQQQGLRYFVNLVSDAQAIVEFVDNSNNPVDAPFNFVAMGPTCSNSTECTTMFANR